jgi:phosphoribosylaminoimidazolecarboxamide formyltransferase/IMP cyclohydrolase
VKTLDYRIYLGLLSEEFNDDHRTDLARTGSIAFDLTVCNFYPFEEAAAAPDATVEDLRTHIDIGGPTMLRASAKNFLRVAALCRPDDYAELLAELRRNGGGTTLPWRAARAAEAFRYTAHYEAAIAGALGSHIRSTDLDTIYTEET